MQADRHKALCVENAVLRRIARTVRRRVLPHGRSRSACLLVSSELLTSLRRRSIGCRLVRGGVGGTFHYWIRLPDGRIVDATADQLRNPKGGRMPDVFVGEKPMWYGPTPIRAQILRRMALCSHAKTLRRTDRPIGS
jgi:hypothetical protein